MKRLRPSKVWSLPSTATIASSAASVMTSSTCAAPTTARRADMRATWNRAPRSSSACSRRSASSRAGPLLVSSAIQSSPGGDVPATWRGAG